MEIVTRLALESLLTTQALKNWGRNLSNTIDQFLIENPHGRSPTWLNTLQQLPCLKPSKYRLNQGCIQVSTDEPFDRHQLKNALMSFYPWRKGPYDIHGIVIDAEWRCDRKWQRLVKKIKPLKNQAVLDVGCGNGYYLWRMLGEGAQCAIGVDPMRLFVAQFKAIQHFIGPSLPAFIVPTGLEQLADQPAFNTVFSMGVLYHRKNPMGHIKQLKSQLLPGGQLIIETLIIQGSTSLKPDNRYANMKNVYIIPTIAKLVKWLQAAQMINIQLIDVTATTPQEQRQTQWMPFQSLTNFLDTKDPNKTIEGYQAPVRAIIIAQKPD